MTRAVTAHPERAAYIALAAATTVTGALERHRAHAVVKTPLVPMLQVGLVRRARASRPAGLATLLTATTGAAVGDWFTLEASGGDERGRRRLRAGASAFGVQQAGYIALLLRAGHRPTRRTVVPVVATLAGLALLESRSGDGGVAAPDPVLTGYGVLLGSMAALAMGAPDSTRAGTQAGGAAFLASDATIIVREHLLRGPRAQAAAEAFVLASYTISQALLVDGLEGRIERE
ncbi:hypothetical protein VV01_06685 [Luteipulveratus halotolerans]|uniref:Lysoplasmalogenase n=1 Tax=Luteipulveratus halotolerans TaxID=1631356 RepID=A0A0L6CNM5_9MICO|nr:hypothetical protein VV01_06685 [Luteipulveratus halotolerans]